MCIAYWNYISVCTLLCLFLKLKTGSVFEAFQRFAANLKGILWSSLIIEPRSTSCQAYHQLHILSLKNKRYWSFARLLTCESWSWGLVAFIITLMWCRESIFVEKSTIDFPIFLLFFNTKFPIFPIFSILSFLFSYLFEQPCRWTPCSKGTGVRKLWGHGFS